METRQIGNSDLQITPIGFGAWAIGGGGWEFGWGPQDDRQSITVIREALDVGVNWIDTAAVYGLGRSEEVVARALDGVKQRPYVFTKCSMVWDASGNISHSLKPESIQRECENSLRRLKIEQIDLYQIHWPIPDADIEQGWATLAKLKRQGKVRNIGVSNFNVAQMRRAEAIAPITCLQPPYSLIRRDVEAEILPFAARENIGVIAYSPMGSGLLTGAMTRERIAGLPFDDWRRDNTDFREPRLSRNLELVQVLREIGGRYGRTPAQVAVAWVLRNLVVTGAILGARRPGQFIDLVAATQFQLDAEDVLRIDSLLAASGQNQSLAAAR